MSSIALPSVWCHSLPRARKRPCIDRIPTRALPMGTAPGLSRKIRAACLEPSPEGLCPCFDRDPARGQQALHRARLKPYPVSAPLESPPKVGYRARGCPRATAEACTGHPFRAIFLLSYRLASPVRWFETRGRLFRQYVFERVVEACPSPTPTRIAALTLKAFPSK